MADFTLTVGVDADLSYTEMQNGIKDVIDKINSKPQEIKVKFDESSIKEMQDKLSSVYKTMNSTSSGSGAASSIKAVTQATKEATSAANARATAEKNVANALNQSASADTSTSKAVSQRTTAEKSYYSTLTQVQRALNNYTAAKNSNKASSQAAYSALSQEKDSLQAAKTAYDSGSMSVSDFKDKVNSASVTLKDSTSTIQANGDATKTLSERIGNLATKFSSWLTVSQAIMVAIRSIKQMVSSSIELDDAMTQLKIVTNETEEAYVKFGDTIASTAQKIGASITDLTDSVTTYARLGYDLEDSSTLAEFTSMLQNVGDIEVSDAQDAITSMIKAFDIDTNDIESVMDKLVAVGNNYPISVSQIAEGMTNASSTLAAAGNSLEESIALLTAANTTIQDASKSSTGLRTIAARIRNTTSELDELGETMTEASYEELVQQLTDCNVALTDMNGEYRSTYDIMSDIAAQWDNMTSMEQAALATALSGTRQQAVFYSIIEQFQEASGSMDTMADSAGTLQDSYNEFLESVTAHINTFKAAFQQLSSNLMQSDFLEMFVDAGTAILNMVNNVVKLVNAVGGLKTVLAAVVSVIVVLNANSIWGLFKDTLPTKIVVLMDSFMSLGTTLSSLPSALSAAASGTTTLSTALQAAGISATTAQIGFAALIAVVWIAVTAFNSMKKATEEAIESASTAADEWSDSDSSLNDYISRIKELRESLDNGTLSEEEAYSAKKELLSIQDELSESYGDQVNGINLVTGAYEEQIQKLEELSQQEAQTYLDTNREGITAIKAERAENISNQVGNGWNLGTFYNTNTNGGTSDALQAIKNVLGEYSDYFDINGDEWNTTITFNGNAEEAETVISDVMTDIHAIEDSFDGDDSNVIQTFLDNLSAGLSEADSIIKENQSTWEEIESAELRADTTKFNAGGTSQTASKWLSDYSEAVEAYNEALALGDEDSIAAAKENYERLSSILNGFVSEVPSWSYADEVAEIAGELDEASAAANDFKKTLEADSFTDDLGEQVTGVVETIKNADLSDTEFENILNYLNLSETQQLDGVSQDVTSAVNLLEYFAEQAGVSTDTLISLLTELGVVSSDTTEEVTDAVDEATALANELSDIEAAISAKEKSLELKEAKGESATEDDYRTLIRGQQEEIQVYEQLIAEAKEEQQALLDAGGSVEGDEYRELTESIHEYEEGIVDAQIAIEGYGDAIEELKPIESVDGFFANEDYSDALSDYTDKLEKLSTAYNDLMSGDLDASDIVELEELFPELIGHTDDTEELGRAIQGLMSDIIGLSDDAAGAETVMGLFNQAIEEVGGETTEAGAALAQYRDDMLALYELNPETTATNLGEYLASLEDTGLDDVVSQVTSLSESLQSLESGELELEDVVSLIEEFPELADYVDFTAENFGDLDEGLRKLIKDSPEDFINSLKEFKETADLTAEEAAQIDALCESVENLSSEAIRDASGEYGVLAEAINAATKAQSELDEALSEDDYDTGYEGRVEAFEGLKDTLEAGEVGSKAMAAYKEYFGLVGQSADEVEAWAEANSKYFTENTDGIIAWLNTIESMSNAGTLDGIASYDSSTGEFWYDINELDAFAEALGWTEEMVEDFIQKYRMYCEEWTSRDASDSMTELTNAGLVFDVGDDTFASLDKLMEYTGLSEEEVLNLVDAMNALRAESNLGEINLIGSDDIIVTQESIDRLLEAGATVEQISTLIQELAGQDNVTIEAGLKINETDVDSLIADSTTDSDSAVSVDITMSVNDEEVLTTVTTTADAIKTILGDDYNIDVESGQAEFNIEQVQMLLENLPDNTLVTVSDVTAGVRSNLQSIISYLNTISANANKTVTVTYRSVGQSVMVDGTAHAYGTAYASGDWRAKGSGTALGGELGTEIVVRDGKWFTVGDNGAEFFSYQPNDIIFNADQTSQIFKYGKIKHGKRRGTTYADGTAYAGGSSSTLSKTSSSSSSSSSSGSSSSSSSTSSTTETALEKFQDWFSQLFDWIEVKLERQTQKISRYIQKAENYLNDENYAKSASYYAKAINTTANQIGTEESASTKYTSKANSVLKKAQKQGLITAKQASSIKSSVANGTMNIASYSDEVQEVISSYMEWTDKATEASDAVDELHANIQTYIQDLKDLRDAQRDATIESTETYESIATSGYAYTASEKNSQLGSTNNQLRAQNTAYSTATAAVASDTATIASNGTSAITSALSSSSAKKNSAYKKALQNAQKAINSNTAVSDSDLNTIKSYSTTVYEKLYAYNEALENLETARLEEATNYAATRSEIYANIAETYENMDSESEDKIDLYEQKASNASSAKEANSYLSAAASQYDTILSNDRAEISRYSSDLTGYKSTISGTAATSALSKLDSSIQSEVSTYTEMARTAAKSGVAIEAYVLEKLAEYYSDGYITAAFYNACVDYNNALAYKEQAEAQLEIDEQTVKAEKASLGQSMIDNIQTEYENKKSANASAMSLLQAEQDTKLATGASLTQEDYAELIAISQEEQDLLAAERDALLAQIQENLSNGLWTEDSQEYLDAVSTVDDLGVSIQECETKQIEYNNAAAQIPIDQLEEALELVNALSDALDSIASYKTTKGLDLTLYNDYLEQAASYADAVQYYYEEMQKYYEGYQSALASDDGTYNGKSVEDWLNGYYDNMSSMYSAKENYESTINSIGQLPFDAHDEIIDLYEAAQSYEESKQAYLEAQGYTYTEADFANQYKYLQNQLEQIQANRDLAYSYYELAKASADGVYYGQTANEWLTQYFQYCTDVYDVLTDINDIESEIVDNAYKELDAYADLLAAITACDDALMEIKETRGVSLDTSDYQTQITDRQNQIAQYTAEMAQLYEDWQTAIANGGSYADKTADEWGVEYYNMGTKINNLVSEIEELYNEIAQMPYDEIEAALDLLDSIASYNESVANLKSSLGEDLSEADYLQQISDVNDKIEQYETERKQAYQDYLTALASTDQVYGGKTADEWLAEYYEYGTTINELESDIEDLKDSLRDDVFWRTFERAHDSCERFASVVSGLKDLISEDMYFDDEGDLTDYGVAQVANLVAEYETARREVSNYSADIENLNKLYEEGYYTQEEYTEMLNELQTSMLDSASSMKSAISEIVDMYKDAAQSELDALFELIDARNDALSAKKEYYDYDKTISDKTSEISTLKAQIAALEGVETAEARAKKATLEAQLAEAEEDLDDTVNEHLLGISQDALDDMKTALQDAFDDKWDNIDGDLEAMADILAAANDLTVASTNTINSTLNKLLAYYGIDAASTGIDAYYASGTKKVSRDMTAMTNENGDELVVTKEGILLPLEYGDGVIPADLTDKLFDLARFGGVTAQSQLPSINIPSVDMSGIGTTVEQHYDSLINIEGSADAATVEDLKGMQKQLLQQSYDYTRKKMYQDYQTAGGKRYV